MFHPRRLRTPRNRSANSVSNFKRSLLLPLLIVMALVGVVFSGASRSVHSSDAVVTAENGAKQGGTATNARGDSNPAGFVRATAKSDSQTSSASTPASGAGNEQA